MQSVQGKTAEFSAMLCDGDNNLSPRICCSSLEQDPVGALTVPAFFHNLKA